MAKGKNQAPTAPVPNVPKQGKEMFIKRARSVPGSDIGKPKHKINAK